MPPHRYEQAVNVHFTTLRFFKTLRGVRDAKEMGQTVNGKHTHVGGGREGREGGVEATMVAATATEGYGIWVILSRCESHISTNH